MGTCTYRQAPLWIAVLASWGLAFFECCLQVPATASATAWASDCWNVAIGFGLIAVGATFVLKPW
jgi:uncharacterized protein (DUF486 family)